MHIPLRMCAACRTHRQKHEMIRLAADKTACFAVPDTDNRAFGRGVYICRSAECIRLAEKKRVVERHLRVKADGELFRRLEDMI